VSRQEAHVYMYANRQPNQTDYSRGHSDGSHTCKQSRGEKHVQ